MNVATAFAVRRTGPFLAVVMALSGGSWWIGPATLVYDFNPFRSRVELGYPELCGVVVAGAAAAILRPRFWEWERLGGTRAGWLAAGYAVIGAASALPVTALGTLPGADGSDLAYMVSNAAVMSAVIFLAAPLVGPVVAGPVVLCVYLAHGLVNNLWWDLAFLPITRYPDRQTHWVAALVLLVAAAAVHYRTRGATAWAQRMFARDE